MFYIFSPEPSLVSIIFFKEAFTLNF